MAKKQLAPSFDAILNALRSQDFEVTNSGSAVRLSKYGVAAVLESSLPGQVSMIERPGILINGEIARLVDRGYQKFFTTPHFELPASSTQLEALHRFTAELKLIDGGTSLYNESLGTVSDRYLYDRVSGRDKAHHPHRPWDTAGAH